MSDGSASAPGPTQARGLGRWSRASGAGTGQAAAHLDRASGGGSGEQHRPQGKLCALVVARPATGIDRTTGVDGDDEVRARDFDSRRALQSDCVGTGLGSTRHLEFAGQYARTGARAEVEAAADRKST